MEIRRTSDETDSERLLPRPKSGISVIRSKKLPTGFDGEAFLANAGVGKTVVNMKKNAAAFSQGAPADAVFYIQKGKVQLTVVSKIGKEATLGILSDGEFFGEGGLAGQPLRMGSATAMTDCELLRIDKKEMMLALHREHMLLLLAHFGKEGVPETVIPKISQENLADMMGTTRSRVSFFMNRFRKLGFVHDDGGSGLQVHSSLLSVVLHD
jgi:CRP/FNR family cyclic AMP-dependent transcriptional regulator